MSYAVANLDDIEETTDGRCPWRPVRHHFGITSFGINAWTGREAGDRIINEHDEKDEQEELYLVQRGRARFELDVAPNHLNPNGTVHGGVIYSLADSAMGTALFSQLDGRQWCATLEIKMNYLLPVTAGAIAAEAVVVSRSKRIGVLEARVLGDGDRLVALATGTFYIQTVRAEVGDGPNTPTPPGV